MSSPTVVPPHPLPVRRRTGATVDAGERLRIVAWLDPNADPHGVHPCSRYVELYWLPVIGPSAMG